MTLTRLRRGQETVNRKGYMQRLAHNQYAAQSQESAKYTVRFGGKSTSCECPDHQYNKTVVPVRKYVGTGAVVHRRHVLMQQKPFDNGPGGI